MLRNNFGHSLRRAIIGAGAYEYPRTGLVWEVLNKGNADDTSGNNNNGIITGATLANDRFGNPNSAYLFNASTDIENFGDVALFELDTFTMLSWVKRNSINTEDNFHSQQYQSAAAKGICGVMFGFSASNTLLAGVIINNTFENVETSETFTNTSDYYFCALTKLGTEVKIYVGAVLKKTGNLSSAVIDYGTSGTKKTTIGGRWNSATGLYVGNLDGVGDDSLLYNRAMELPELLEIHNRSKP